MSYLDSVERIFKDCATDGGKLRSLQEWYPRTDKANFSEEAVDEQADSKGRARFRTGKHTDISYGFR